MKKKIVNEHLIDFLITKKLNVPLALYALDGDSLLYLKNLQETYGRSDFDSAVEKYEAMLMCAGETGRTKICRDIRQCISNLKKDVYVKEYDHSEDELGEDMMYIQMILDLNFCDQ